MIKSRELVGKPIVTIQHGKIVGKVRDVLIDPERYEIAALVLPGRLLSRKTMIMPRHQVHVFGEDVILVKSDEAMPRDDTLEKVASLIAVSKQMRGQEIVTEKGARIGIVDDVMIDEQGRVISYALSRVTAEGPVAANKRIPLSYTRTLGPDVIIVDSSALTAGESDDKEELEPIPD
jgi:sporulation protein YlmC with PRC-barrel domain